MDRQSEAWENGFKAAFTQLRDITDMIIKLEDKGVDVFDLLQDKIKEIDETLNLK